MKNKDFTEMATRKILNGTWRGKLPKHLAHLKPLKKENKTTKKQTSLTTEIFSLTETAEKEAVAEVLGHKNGITEVEAVLSYFQSTGLLKSGNLLRPPKATDNVFFDTSVLQDNAVIGYGDVSKVRLAYNGTRQITFNVRQLDLLIRNNPHIKNAIDYLSTLPLMNGIDINAPEQEMDSMELYKVSEVVKSLYVSLKDGLSKHYTYGGSGLLIWLENETIEDLGKPLYNSSIRKGTFKGLKPLSRWYGIEPAIEKGLITEIGANNSINNAIYLGTPEYYYINLTGGLGGLESDVVKNYNKANTGRILVHVSRLIIFNAELPSAIETQVERYWGASLIETMYNSLVSDTRLWNATQKTAEKNNLGILKIDGLGLVGTLNNAVRNRVDSRISLIREGSSYKVIPIDAKDEFKFANAVLSGQVGILQISAERLAGAAKVPKSVLFPDNNSEKNTNIPTTSITVARDIQERLLRPAFEKLLPIIIKSELGKQVKDVVFQFNPIETMSLEEKAKMFNIMAEGLEKLYRIGIDKASILSMLDDVRKDPINIAQNINKNFKEYIINKAKNNEFETKQSDQIEVAIALNQLGGVSGVHNPESDIGGEEFGGDKKTTKKPLERNVLNREKAKKQ